MGTISFEMIKAEVKRTLKRKKWTYGQLAEKLGLSESAIKKIFAADDSSFKRINEICDVIGVDLADLILAMEQRPAKRVTFTEQQEELFLSDSRYFYTYWKLVFERLTAEEIKAQFKMTDREFKGVLRKLDKVNLIVLDVGERIQIPKIKLVDLAKEGEFLSAVMSRWAHATVDEAFASEDIRHFTLQYFQLLPGSVDEFLEALHELVSQFARRTVREMNLYNKEELTPVKVIGAISKGSFINDLV